MTKKSILSFGNAKMPASVAIFNLLAIEDCPNCETCKDTCYAKFRQGLPSIYAFRKRNSDMARNDTEGLYKILCQELSERLVARGTKPAVKQVRIHEAGDFISAEYYTMWVNVAKRFPMLKFFAFTKCDHLQWHFDNITADNLNIINSTIDGKYRNYGSKEYCQELVKNCNAYQCPDTSHNNICMVQCKYCLRGKKPCFEIHGSLKGKDKYETGTQQ